VYKLEWTPKMINVRKHPVNLVGKVYKDIFMQLFPVR
jgi:hypothetical protein